MGILVRRRKQSGVALTEVLIAIGLVTSVLFGVGLTVNVYVEARSNLVYDLKTLYFAEEGQEVIFALRDQDWTNLSVLSSGSRHYLSIATSTMGVTTTPEIIEGEYSRFFTVEQIERDGDDDISFSGGTADSGALYVEVTVGGPSGTTTLSSVITNLHAI